MVDHYIRPSGRPRVGRVAAADSLVTGSAVRQGADLRRKCHGIRFSGKTSRHLKRRGEPLLVLLARQLFGTEL